LGADSSSTGWTNRSGLRQNNFKRLEVRLATPEGNALWLFLRRDGRKQNVKGMIFHFFELKNIFFKKILKNSLTFE
jgi:hypothetical protein